MRPARTLGGYHLGVRRVRRAASWTRDRLEDFLAFVTSPETVIGDFLASRERPKDPRNGL